MNQETKTPQSPIVLSQLNLDEEIAYAIFNEGVPDKYKNNPKEFEKYLMSKNKIDKNETQKNTTEITQSKSKKSFTNILKSFFKTRETSNYKPLITPLLMETPLTENFANQYRI
jgi:hypothetical protein